jgi:hypothetical protein
MLILEKNLKAKDIQRLILPFLGQEKGWRLKIQKGHFGLGEKGPEKNGLK